MVLKSALLEQIDVEAFIEEAFKDGQQPRSYQIEAILSLWTNIATTYTNVPDGEKPDFVRHLIQQATGTGKGSVICWIAILLATMHDGRNLLFDSVVVVSDRTELVDQSMNRFLEMGIKSSTPIKFAKPSTADELEKMLKSDHRGIIIVTSIQKLSKLGGAGIVKGKNIAIVADEVHRSWVHCHVILCTPRKSRSNKVVSILV